MTLLSVKLGAYLGAFGSCGIGGLPMSAFNVRFLGILEQVVHLGIKDSNGSMDFLISFVYASTNFLSWKSLCMDLEAYADSFSLPCCVMGDFNDIISLDEKLGRKPANPSKCSQFQYWGDNCGLADLGCDGPKFTWWNMRQSPASAWKRLERALANEEWTLRF
ncbi:hypothetical protein Nepgr_008479 [Nepenthes gracilis]|uniref:Endonuclease/exonuclease/phosphatase family protein n=1 Tax=Nepenthes gracilis TaxID=150966 RepID=A0AAD3S9C9_NEPGR|nr:hypothetical protein Nepgr_008479 [Nepenthes gracilis]